MIEFSNRNRGFSAAGTVLTPCWSSSAWVLAQGYVVCTLVQYRDRSRQLLDSLFGGIDLISVESLYNQSPSEDSLPSQPLAQSDRP